MARKIRIEDAGYHHVYNRGVERRVIFDTTQDKEKFLEIVCEVSEHYDFTIHAYVLMSNHYHLLLENQRENLSAGMRQINVVSDDYDIYWSSTTEVSNLGYVWSISFNSGNGWWSNKSGTYYVRCVRSISIDD